jgi:hypothetical protein
MGIVFVAELAPRIWRRGAVSAGRCAAQFGSARLLPN